MLILIGPQLLYNYAHIRSGVDEQMYKKMFYNHIHNYDCTIGVALTK